MLGARFPVCLERSRQQVKWEPANRDTAEDGEEEKEQRLSRQREWGKIYSKEEERFKEGAQKKTALLKGPRMMVDSGCRL